MDFFVTETEINARGILREVWDTARSNDGPDTLRTWNVFKPQSRFWNLIKIMDTPTNFGDYYAQKLSAYMKVNNFITMYYFNSKYSC